MVIKTRAERSRYTLDVPRQYKDEFDALCALQGLNMCDIIRKFIIKYVDGDKAILKAMKEKYAIAKDGQ